MSKNALVWTRRIVLVAALAAVLATPLLWSTAEAVIIAGPSVCTYYSDATYTTVVGARGTGCCGTVINWGITTLYVKCQKLYCPDVQCPQ